MKLPGDYLNKASIIQFSRNFINNKSGQDILWNVASFGIMGICGILLNFIIASARGSAVLGVFSQAYAVYIISSQFSAVGVHLSVLKYVAEYADQPHQYRLIITAGLVLSVIFGLLTCAIVWLMRGMIGFWMSSPGVAVGIAWAIPGLFFFTLNKVYLSVLNGLARMKLYAVFQAARYFLMILVVVILVLAGAPDTSFTSLFSVTELILFICLFIVNIHETGVPTIEILRVWMRKHLDFGLRGFLSNVLLGLNPRVDVLVLGYFCSDKIVGIFSLAAIAAEGLYQLAVVLRTNINPVLVQLIAGEKLDELKRLSQKSIRLTYLAMASVTVAAVCVYPAGWFFVKNKVDFLQSWPLFAVLAVGIAASAGYIPFSNILMLAGRPGMHTIMIVIQVTFNIIGDIVLIPIFGSYGAAVTTAMSYILLVLLVKTFCKRILKLEI